MARNIYKSCLVAAIMHPHFTGIGAAHEVCSAAASLHRDRGVGIPSCYPPCTIAVQCTFVGPLSPADTFFQGGSFSYERHGMMGTSSVSIGGVVPIYPGTSVTFYHTNTAGLMAKIGTIRMTCNNQGMCDDSDVFSSSMYMYVSGQSAMALGCQSTPPGQPWTNLLTYSQNTMHN